MRDLAFLAMIAFFATHELDAMWRHEWRIFPGLSRLRDDIGRRVFLLSHVPAFYVLVWIAQSGSESTAAAYLSAFAVLHVGLHFLFRNHPKMSLGTRVRRPSYGQPGYSVLCIWP